MLSLLTPVNRMFDELDNLLQANGAIRETPTMPFDIHEDENNWYLEVDVPGMTEKDLEITIDQGTLKICGNRQRTRKKNEYSYQERSWGRFERSLKLPKTLQTDKISAELNNGVLTVRLEKKAEAQPRRIAIKSLDSSKALPDES